MPTFIMTIVKCSYCSLELVKFPSEIKKNTSRIFYCSSICRTKFHSKAVNCLHCKSEITRSNGELNKSPNTFCSKSCSNKYSPRHKPKKRTCRRCKADYICEKNHKSYTTCPECQKEIKENREAFLDSTIEDYQKKPSVKNKPRHWINVHIRMFNRNWNKKLYKNPCQNCGYFKHVELAHIKDIADFPLTAKLREVNDPNNILVLCPNCHWEFDYGDLKLEQINERN